MQCQAPLPSKSVPSHYLGETKACSTARVHPATQYFLSPSLPFRALLEPHTQLPKNFREGSGTGVFTGLPSALTLQNYVLYCSNKLGTN